MNIEVLTEIPGTHRSSFAHVISDDDLYIIGGHPGTFHKYEKDNFSSEVHAYNFGSNTWRECAPLPRSAQGLRAISYGNFIYTLGGFSFDSTLASSPWSARSLDQVYRYSPIDDTWEKITTMPRRRSSHVCEIVGDKVYLIGGWDGTPLNIGNTKGVFVTAIDVFDLKKEKFIPSCLEFSSLPNRRAFSSSFYNGKIILSGGLGYEGYMSSDLFSDVISIEFPEVECEKNTGRGGGFKQGKWELLPQLPLPMFSPGSGVVKGKLLVAGGLGPVLPPYNGKSRSQVLQLNEKNKTWEQLPVSMSEGKSFVEVEELPNGCAGFIGGHRGYESDSLPTNKIECLVW